jgi:hypothetical protein
MNSQQIAKQCYNQRYYDLHGNARRKQAREYYYANREKVLAQKKAKGDMA